jgi:hypothetical protein
LFVSGVMVCSICTLALHSVRMQQWGTVPVVLVLLVSLALMLLVGSSGRAAVLCGSQ